MRKSIKMREAYTPNWVLGLGFWVCFRAWHWRQMGWEREVEKCRFNGHLVSDKNITDCFRFFFSFRCAAKLFNLW